MNHNFDDDFIQVIHKICQDSIEEFSKLELTIGQGILGLAHIAATLFYNLCAHGCITENKIVPLQVKTNFLSQIDKIMDEYEKYKGKK